MKQLFVFEWLTGGGMWLEPSAPLPVGKNLQQLAREGQLMVDALARDISQCRSLEMTLLRDNRLAPLHEGLGARCVSVGTADALPELLSRCAEHADHILLIAPESCDRLARCQRWLREHNCRLVSPGPSFVALASDKTRTSGALQAAGVAVPPGVELDGTSIELAGLVFPAIAKPVVGAGSENIERIASAEQARTLHTARRTRLETLVPGTPVGIGVIAGPNRVWSLPATRQLLDSAFAYQGASYPLEATENRRAVELARAAIAALPPTVGYIGIDLVLGPAPDGTQDFVIEVNPRLTTSFALLQQLAQGNLTESMVRIATGDEAALAFDRRQAVLRL